jgi:hypothetical protein
MALSQSAVSELLEAFRTGDGVDLIRESVRMVMQELIEAEAAEKIGAARYERTKTRTTDRNGARSRSDAMSRRPCSATATSSARRSAHACPLSGTAHFGGATARTVHTLRRSSRRRSLGPSSSCDRRWHTIVSGRPPRHHVDSLIVRFRRFEVEQTG